VRPRLNNSDSQWAELPDEFPLGVSVLGGGRTTIPEEVMEFLGLRYSPKGMQKVLWSQEGTDVLVKKGTLQSGFRKTILTRGGKAAFPKHIREALEPSSTSDGAEKILWMRRGEDVIVSKGKLYRREQPTVSGIPHKGPRSR
jgi:bifunctional DNA-binding transcriptional regulator/antitoxin component of YhaV-PrlF toxin-antitoxin module